MSTPMITITVWKTAPKCGLDREGVNTICIRWPNTDRVKGEPREHEFFETVPAYKVYWLDRKNHLGETGGYGFAPDFEAIQNVIDRWRDRGEVQVRWNCESPDKIEVCKKYGMWYAKNREQ